MTPVFALVGYYEPWWIQIIKAIVIFAVVLQLLPMIIVAELHDFRRFHSARALKAYLGLGPQRTFEWGARATGADHEGRQRLRPASAD